MGMLAPMSGIGGSTTVRVDAAEMIHLFRPLRPGQIRGEPWLARALVKLNELDQYDDAELVRKKTAAMFAGFVTRMSPEDNLLGEGCPTPMAWRWPVSSPAPCRFWSRAKTSSSRPGRCRRFLLGVLRHAVSRSGGRDGRYLRACSPGISRR
jgi:hypothetical protein